MWSVPPKPPLPEPGQHKISKLCERVLQLLRSADKSGKWPYNTLRRNKVIHKSKSNAAGPAKAVAATKNVAGSFSVGSMPPPLKQPRSNTIFFELMMAAFQLERELVRQIAVTLTCAVSGKAIYLCLYLCSVSRQAAILYHCNQPARTG